MITARTLRELPAHGAGLALIEGLGYAIDPVEIDHSDWSRCGLDLGLDDQVRLWSAGRVGRVAWLVAESSADAPDPVSLVRCLQRHNNVLIYILIFHSLKTNIFSILPSGIERGNQRLDLDPARPRPDVIERINLLRWIDGESIEKGLLRRLHAAFDRDSLSRQFVSRFSRATDDLSRELRATCPKEEEATVADEALLILTRLLFLTFLQQKGWLGGDRHYLARRIAGRQNEGCWGRVVAPLFFECLNTPLDRRGGSSRELGEIPYLNGGLFDRSAFELRNPDLAISGALVTEVVEDVFERFTFSLREDDENGVHIDPEMLGRVFESLMERSERARTGTFYTPREIVDPMVERAISEILAEKTGFDPALLRQIASDGLVEVDPDRIPPLIDGIQNLRVLDPACGSGAFLLAALRFIERLWSRLAALAGIDPPHDLRRRIVESSLFGLDIKPQAVRLCELRLWLAIVSDPTSAEDGDYRAIPPLPNLDRNVRQGHALLGPIDFFGDGRLDIYRDWSVGLRAKSRMEERYRHASAEDKPSLARALHDSDRQLAMDLLRRAIELDRAEIDRELTADTSLFPDVKRIRSSKAGEALEARLANSRARYADAERGEIGFFAWEIHFAHILGDGGFDVVVGNPPWVRRANIAPEIRAMLDERYETFGSGGGLDQSDLAVAFFERSVRLARDGGVVDLLVPSKILTAGYGATLRQWISRNHRLVSIDDWTASGRRRFPADAFPISLCVKRGKASRPSDDVRSSVVGWMENPADPWMLAPEPVIEIVRALRGRFGTLANVLGRRPLMGVKTGANRLFFLDVAEIRGDRVVLTDGLEIPSGAVSRCVRGRDVRRWKAMASTWMLWPPAKGWREPPAWAIDFARRAGLDANGLRLSWVKPEHLGVKVAWKDVSRGLQAVVLPESATAAGRSFPLVPNQTLYSLDASSLDEAYVLSAILNSTVVNALVSGHAEQAKDSHFRYFGRLIADAPLPRIRSDDKEWISLSRLARRAHQGGEIQQDLDAVVSRLYGLDADQFGHLSRYLEARLST